MARDEKEKLSPEERRQQHAEKIAALIRDQMQRGVAPWQQPWENSKRFSLPHNATTGKTYRGSNAVYLMAKSIENGYTDGRWLTFNQAKSIGASVRKGEKGTPICFPATHYEKIERDSAGKPVIGEDGKPKTVWIQYDRPRTRYYTVFAAEQCDGMPAREVKEPQHEWERHERAEAILKESGARIQHGGNRAYYMPGLDYIQLPTREQFDAGDKYYATALHELGHWTGHEDRLKRDLSGGFGSESYAREELRAEISSLMVGTELGIGHDPGQHVAYVDHWVKILQDKPTEILDACADANKIHEYVMQYDHEIEREHTHEIENEAEHLQPAHAIRDNGIEGHDQEQQHTPARAFEDEREYEAALER